MTSVIDKDSTLASYANVDLFSIPPTQVTALTSKVENFYLDSIPGPQGPWIISLPPHTDFLDLNDHYLRFQMRITKEDGSALTATDLCAPIDNLGHSVWGQIKVFINNKLIHDTSDTYPYQALIETWFNYSKQAKETVLQTVGYTGDFASQNDDPAKSINSFDNSGFNLRRERLAKSKWAEYYVKLSGALFNSDRLYPPQTPFRIELYRSSNEFCLFTEDEDDNDELLKYKLEIRDVSLQVRYIKLLASQHLATEQKMLTQPARYPFRRVGLQHFFLAAGGVRTPNIALISGRIPRRLIFGFVKTEHFYGSYAASPFNFQHMNVSSVQLRANSKNFPEQPIKLDYAKNHYTEAYLMAYQMACGDKFADSQSDLTMFDFKYGRNLYCFNLTPLQIDSSSFELITQGSIFLDVHFSKPIPAGGVELILFHETDFLLMMDKYRNTYFDYQ